MKNATIKETASGKFFISLTFDAEIKPKERKRESDKIEAFDYSMPSLVVSASGENDITLLLLSLHQARTTSQQTTSAGTAILRNG